MEFELARAPHLIATMGYTYRERHGEAIYRFKNGMLPIEFFRRNVVLGFQEDAIGIRLRDVIGPDNSVRYEVYESGLIDLCFRRPPVDGRVRVHFYISLLLGAYLSV